MTLKNLSIQTRQCNTPYGVLQYKEGGIANPEGLFLVHGIGASSSTWDTQILTLQSRFRVLAWDAPGYSKSSALPMDEPDVFNYAEALESLLDAVNIERVHLVASSWGALIALALAAHFPDRIGKIILGGPSAGYAHLPAPDRAQMLADRIACVEQFSLPRMLQDSAHKLVAPENHPSTCEKLAADSREVYAQGYAQALHSLFSCNGATLAAQVQKPVLTICGAVDSIAPLAMHGQRLAAEQPPENFIVYADCGHLPHLERSARFNADLVSFIDSNL